MSYIKYKKKVIREKIFQISANLNSHDKLDAERKVTNQLLCWLKKWNTKGMNINIGFFSNLKDEISTNQIDFHFMKMGYNRFLPIMNEKTPFLREIPKNTLFKHIKKKKINIITPLNNFKKANFSNLDILILPGIAFDKKGNRLGRGKGYYDKALSTISQKSKTLQIIGLAFDFQILKNLPIDKHDRPVNLLCSPLMGMRLCS